MADFIIATESEHDKKELRVWSRDKDGVVVIGVEGKSEKETMCVGISLDKHSVKCLIEFLQKQINKKSCPHQQCGMASCPFIADENISCFIAP